MIRIAEVPTPINPVLIDKALIEIQSNLSGISWLNHAFGKAQKGTRIHKERQVFFPSVYVGGKDYMQVFPDSHIGNFSFFCVEDGDVVNYAGFKSIKDFTASIGLVVWYDFRTVYESDWEERTIEHAKNEVIQLLKSMNLTKSRIQIKRIYDEADNIYKGFTHDEIDRQFLMRPFGGFRIDIDLVYWEKQKC